MKRISERKDAVTTHTQKEKPKLRDTTYATVTRWTEYRTPSGRWSQARHDVTKEVFRPYNLAFFFDAKFRGERREYTHFEQDYLPYRVTVPSPDGSERRVYKFQYYTGPREIVTYTYED